MRSKKLSCILLTGALAISGITGCSKKPDDTQTTAEVTQAVATTQAATEEETKTDETKKPEENNAEASQGADLPTKSEETSEAVTEPETEKETEKETEAEPEKDQALSENAADVLKILTGIYDMKGMSYESNMTLNGVDLSLLAKLDYKNNYSCTVIVRQPILEELPIKGELMTLTLLDNDLYVDLRKAYEQIEQIAGKDAIAQVDQMLSTQMGLSISDLLVIKMSLGNLDRDGVSFKSIKPLYEIILRACVKALDETGLLKNGEDVWYEFTLEKNEKFSAFVTKAVNEILSEKEKLVQEAFTLIEAMKLPENADTIVREFMDKIKENLKRNLGEEDYKEIVQDLEEIEELNVKKLLADAIASLKEEQKTLLETVPDTIPAEIVEQMYNEYDGIFKMQLVGEGDGYTLYHSFAMFGDEVEAYTTVREYDQAITVPQGAKDVDTLSVMMAVLAPQYIRYIEKSKEATDHMLEQEIITAIRMVSLDEHVYSTLEDEFLVSFDGTELTTSLKDGEAMLAEVRNLIGSSHNGWKSKTYRGVTLKFKVVFDKENSSVRVECENSPYRYND